MADSLEGKVAIVTGGARGIGHAYSRALAAEGAAVVVADLLEQEGRETVETIRENAGRALYQHVDVADADSVGRLATAAASEFGGIDILVNNAAMFASLRGGPFLDIDAERWDRTMAVNVKGAFLCIQAVVPHMRARGGGAIVNQSSIAAFGLAGMLDYSVSKSALIGLTKNVALELGADRIRVNCIAPGGVATEANAGHIGGGIELVRERAKANQAIPEAIRPEDMVGPLLYLVGDASKLMTGQTVVFDGGRFLLG